MVCYNKLLCFFFSREMCIRFADLERKLGEIDRARAVYMHASQMADPRVCLSLTFFTHFLNKWELTQTVRITVPMIHVHVPIFVLSRCERDSTSLVYRSSTLSCLLHRDSVKRLIQGSSRTSHPHDATSFFPSRFPRIKFLFFHFQTTPTFWKEWHDFEVRHGNEDTFREMLRIKRSVQAQFNTQVSKVQFGSFGLRNGRSEFCPYKNIPQSKTVLIFCHFVKSVRYAGCNLENFLVLSFASRWR